VVAIEVRRVYFDALDFARSYAQAQDNIIVFCSVVAAGFPAIIPGTGEDEDAWFANWRGGCGEVGGFGEPFVAEGEDAGAERFGEKIYKGGTKLVVVYV
jgi:hypothetical protein